MPCYEDPDRRCSICGSKNISRWYSSKYNISPAYCSFRCRAIGQRNIYLVLTIIMSIISIVLLIILFIESWNPSELLISFSFSLILLVIFIFNTMIGFEAYKKTQKPKLVNSRSTDLKPTDSIASSFYSSAYEQERILTPIEYAYRKNKPLFPYYPEKKLLEPFQMEKESNNSVCMICKLTIDYLEMVYRCPKCQHYFHEKHLDNWLIDNSNCPVCGYALKD